MSHDDIEDLIEKLQEERMMYCIAVNRPETNRFTVWTNAASFDVSEDGISAQDSIREAIEKAMDIDEGSL